MAVPSSFGFGRPIAKRAKNAFGGFNNQQSSEEVNLSGKEKYCSTFSIAIRRNWQAVAFLMLEYGFELSLAILDCFNYKKYNYVYTLL